VWNVGRTLTIKQIRLDGNGWLLVVPDLPTEEDFDFIYRAGMEIAWRPADRGLSSPAPRPNGWSYGDWFRQILRAAAAEFGNALAIDGEHDLVRT
jgi:hypothetical protein